MDWQKPATEINLAANEIHVWQTRLDDFQSTAYQNLQQLLATDEITRANRFHFEKDRRRFVVSRGVLRVLLGQYLRVLPAQVTLTTAGSGKPVLDDSTASSPLHFNLSHSGAMALFAFSRTAPLGVDLERIQPDILEDALAERFFGPGEVAALRALPPAQQTAAFFTIWTRKEAYLKGIGTGLSLPLDSFEVSVNPDEPPLLLKSDLRPEDIFEWRLYEIPPIPGFAAALTAEPNLSVACWTFAPDTLDQFALF